VIRSEIHFKAIFVFKVFEKIMEISDELMAYYKSLAKEED